MITKSMTSEEVLKELKKDELFILGRVPGLLIKNNKKLKNKFFKHKDIMSVSTYVVPDTQDTAVVFATKQVSTLKGRDYSSMNLSYYYTTSYGTHIMPFFRNSIPVGYIEVTHHAVDRMKMRLGKDFDSFFREDWMKKNDCAMTYVEYNYNGNPNEYVAHVGDAFLILECEATGKKSIVKTILSTEDLHANQLQDKLASKKKMEYLKRLSGEQIDAEAEAHLKILKRMGAMMKVA